MVALGFLVYLPLPVIAIIGLTMVFGHNLLDTVHVSGTGIKPVLWSLFHEPNFYQFGKVTLFIGYPVIPWIGVMALGYCLGRLYEREAPSRKKWLLLMGGTAIVLFVLIRYSNSYGDAAAWSQQTNPAFTVLSFLNVSKYPPSLLYLLMTLGPVLVLLALTEKMSGWLAGKVMVIGRVPMFYYLVHLYLLHLAAVFATYFCGHTPGDMILTGWITFQPQLKGYGVPLAVVYGVWAVLILILYFLCRWYDNYKRSHRYWWLSYL
jgi:uncharacterized membrane protein